MVLQSAVAGPVLPTARCVPDGRTHHSLHFTATSKRRKTMSANAVRMVFAVGWIVLATSASAVSVDVLVGDVDGFGFGCPNIAPAGTCHWPGPGVSGSGYDGRSAAEAAATNGAQITDIYSALFPQFGPNTFTQADVLFQTNQGFMGAGIDTYILDAAQLAAANVAGMVILHFNHFFPGDLIAFDWFRLTGDTSSGPPPLAEPATLLLLWLGLAGVVVTRRRASG